MFVYLDIPDGASCINAACSQKRRINFIPVEIGEWRRIHVRFYLNQKQRSGRENEVKNLLNSSFHFQQNFRAMHYMLLFAVI